MCVSSGGISDFQIGGKDGIELDKYSSSFNSLSSPRSPVIWKIPELQSTIRLPVRSPTVSRRSPAVSLPFKAL